MNLLRTNPLIMEKLLKTSVNVVIFKVENIWLIILKKVKQNLMNSLNRKWYYLYLMNG